MRWLAGRVDERKRYWTDASDELWARIEPVLAAWKHRHPSPTGHQGDHHLRDIVDAIFYQSRSGCQWSLLPNDLPPASAVKYYFYLWKKDGTDRLIHDLLRCEVRERAGRKEEPTAVVLDSQSVHAAVNVPAATTGKDAAKKVPGRQRGLAVDALGLVIAVVCLAASAHENVIGTRLLDKVAAAAPSVRKAFVDQGFKTAVVEHGATVGIDVDIVKRDPEATGFVPQPIRWRVEQTNGTLILHRRLVRDYESDPAVAESRVYWAITHTMGRRLTGQNAATWRTA